METNKSESDDNSENKDTRIDKEKIDFHPEIVARRRSKCRKINLPKNSVWLITSEDIYMQTKINPLLFRNSVLQILFYHMYLVFIL